MLTFLAYTILFWVANACFVRIAYILIQPGQLFGSWQGVLNRMHEANSRLLNSLAKPLGDCALCFAHLLTVFCFVVYVLFMRKLAGLWLTQDLDSTAWTIFFNAVWYFIYGCIGTTLSTLFITRGNRPQ